YDVARFGVDADRTARTHPLHALHGLYKLFSRSVWAGFLERGIDQVYAVISADRHEVGSHGMIHEGSEGLDIRLVFGRVVRRRIVPRSNGAQRLVTHRRHEIIVE